MKLGVSRQFSTNTQISNFMNILPVGNELFHMDGQTERRTDRLTDMTKLIVAFRNFANALKIHSLPDIYLYERFSLFFT